MKKWLRWELCAAIEEIALPANLPSELVDRVRAMKIDRSLSREPRWAELC